MPDQPEPEPRGETVEIEEAPQSEYMKRVWAGRDKPEHITGRDGGKRK